MCRGFLAPSDPLITKVSEGEHEVKVKGGVIWLSVWTKNEKGLGLQVGGRSTLQQCKLIGAAGQCEHHGHTLLPRHHPRMVTPTTLIRLTTWRHSPCGLVTPYLNSLPAFGELPHFEAEPPFPYGNRKGPMPSFPACSAAKIQAHILGSTKQVHLTPISEPEASESVSQGSGSQTERVQYRGHRSSRGRCF